MSPMSPRALWRACLLGVALVDIGGKSEGVVPAGEFEDFESVKLGDVINVLIEKAEDKEGNIHISKEKAEFRQNWDRIQSICNEGGTVTGKVKSYILSSASVSDTGYQARQAKIAHGSGGVFGLGLMHGRQKHFYLPESHTDFIYAVIGEELGLWGTVAILFGYFVIIWRGFRIFLLAPDDFGRLIRAEMDKWAKILRDANIKVE